MRLRRSLALSLAAVAVVGTGTGLSHASATDADPAVSVAPSAAIVDGAWAVAGAVVGPYGKPLDNVAVAAFVGSAATPVASAITYGGVYDLTVDSGTYRVVFTDLDGEIAPVTRDAVVVEGDLTMDRVRMLYPAPEIVFAPKIRGSVNVGKTVAATPGQWTGQDLTYSYEWLVNGRVTGTDSMYRLATKDLGKALSLRVSADVQRTETGVVTTTSKTVLKAISKVKVEKAVVKGNRVAVSVFVTAPTNLKGGQVEVREVGKKGLLGKAATAGAGAWNGKVVLSGVPAGKHTYVMLFTGTKTVGIGSDRTTVKVK